MKAKPLSAMPSPFVFSGLRLESASLVVILTLLIQIVLMISYKDFKALTVILASLVGAAVAELCFVPPVSGAQERYKKFLDGTAAISGFLAGFLLPSSVNPFLAGLASFFGLFISRNFFNGRGNAWISAPALSVIFLYISSPECFYALELYKAPSSLETSGLGYSIVAFLNSAFLNPLSLEMPESYAPLFFDPFSPVPAFKFNIVTFAASVILIALDVADWIAPSLFFLSCAACIYLFPIEGNILYALLSGGVFFAAVYLLSDFSILPRTKTGRAMLGVFTGIIAFFACAQGSSSPLGAAFAVFAASLCSPAIECMETRVLLKFFNRKVLHDRA